jgi:hypothetical protein
MLKSLFYKEWIKTKRIILLMGIIAIALIIYTFINTGQMFRVGGALQTWTNVILKDMAILPEIIKWFPLLAGCLLGLVQFVPEMTDKRLKLTLHLPLPESKILSSMLMYGILALLVIYILMYLALNIGLQLYYPSEIICAMTSQILPCFLGGIAAYFFVSWICIEPVWRQRIFNIIIAISGLSLFSFGAKSGAYIPFIPYLIAIVIIGFYFPFYSTARFKDGAQ